jgi:hypothetical protein
MMITIDISGFGGGYEIACQLMLCQAVKWLEEHPQADPKFHGFKGATGILMEDNADADSLSSATTREVPGGPTGAMHQAVICHALIIRQYGRECWMKKLHHRAIEIPFDTPESMRDWINQKDHRNPEGAIQWPHAEKGDYAR